MYKYQDVSSQVDVDEISQKHAEVPISSRPRFMNQILAKHRSRKRTEAKRRTNKNKIQQLIKNQFQQMQNVTENLFIEEDENLQKKITYVHGNKIEGTWKNGNLHGNVSIQYQTGEIFSGRYMNGVRVQGTVKFNDGTQYTGGFLKDIFHGEGTLTDPSGRIIKCKWDQGEPVQKARIQYPSGDIYFGSIHNLKKHGNGYLFFKNGSKYIGSFVNGSISGYGSYYQSDKKIAEGIWQNGVLQIEQEVKQILLESLKIQKQIRLQALHDAAYTRRRNHKQLTIL